MPIATLHRLSLVLGVSTALVMGPSCHSGGDGRVRVPETKTTSRPRTVAPPDVEPQARKAGDAQKRWFAVPVYFDALVARARSLSRAPARTARHELPSEVSALTYDQYRSIRFRPKHSLWRGTSSEIEAQFFHLGFRFTESVGMHVLNDEESVAPIPLPFSPHLFSYENATPPPVDPELGFAGMRLHTAWNSPEYRDEFIVFQGASYFRTLGLGQVYGLSGRGLAIDLGEPVPEEFPRFSELFLVRPQPGEQFVWVLALLESKRATGAYAFRIEPGAPTSLQVSARVFLREPVGVLGIAPLTSMFLFGEENPARFGHFRPEVHDSDVLLLQAANGEWIARPLRNPSRTTVSSFRLDSPRGFGLLQHDRTFSNYQDLEARYQHRPSAWVEPVDDWGAGALRLLEISTELETDDNIAVAWIPDEVPAEGITLRYRLRVGELALEKQPGHIVATRIETADMPELPKAGASRFVVDFFVPAASIGTQSVSLDVSAQGGRVLEHHTEKNAHVDGYRVSFLVKPDEANREVELRAFLRDDAGGALTRTWSYLWQPK